MSRSAVGGSGHSLSLCSPYLYSSCYPYVVRGIRGTKVPMSLPARLPNVASPLVVLANPCGLLGVDLVRTTLSGLSSTSLMMQTKCFSLSRTAESKQTDVETLAKFAWRWFFENVSGPRKTSAGTH